jgi:hypothetical protein
MEKKLFDSGSYDVDTRNWNIGDIVKVKEYDITYLPTHSYGMILGKGNEEQMKIFPCFNVYIFASHIERIVEVYNLEIISPA